MIRLINGNNTVALTLSEKATLAQPIFLFEFKNIESNKSVFCISADISVFKYRYNKFILNVNQAVSPLIGGVSLVLGSQYDYLVYEQMSATNLDPALALNIVEQGIMIYASPIVPKVQYTNTNGSREVYTG